MTRQLEDWFQSYGEFTTESDSPRIFHMWTCLTTIAGAAQRKIFMQAHNFSVHSNMYLLLVSPPGRAKKGAAMRASKNLLKEAKPGVNFSTESGSFEGMVKLFQEITNPAHQSLSLYSSELGSLMATNPAGMVDFLTDIYDGNADWSRMTMKNSKQTIKHPWLNMVAGTTPAWLGEHLGLIALEGGLIARCIIAYSDELLLENPWPEEDAKLKALRLALINDLSHISTLEGEFKFRDGKSGDAYIWYDKWYRDRSRFPTVYDPRTASYWDRKAIHILKVAMLLSLTYKDELFLDIEDLMRAKDFIEQSSEPGMRLALNSVGKNDSANDLLHIQTQIKTAGKVSYAKLLIDNYHNLRRGQESLDQMLEELARMRRIKREGDILFYIGSEPIVSS